MAKMSANEASKTEAKPDAKPGNPESSQEQVYLGNWKTREQAEEGLSNLQKLLDSQGNELGTLRKQAQLLESRMGKQQEPQGKPQPEQPQGPDYDKELAQIDKQIESLDMDEPGYQAKLAELNAKSRSLVAEMATQKALDAAEQHFSETLSQRDVQDMQRKFYDQHPDFQDPETQMQVDEFLANDPTGMHDPMSGYFALKSQSAQADLQAAQERIAELEERLNIAGGANEVGDVLTKSDGPPEPTKRTRATGADLDRGMLEALRKAK